MRRLERFRWVPMLLRAYYDAQRQVEEKGETLTEEPIRAVKPERSKATTSQRPNRTDVAKPPLKKPDRLRVKPTSPPLQNGRRVAIRPKSEQASRVDRVRKPSDHNVQLFRELRETNRKLEELAAMQKQLDSIGEAMNDVNKQIESLKAQALELEKRRGTPQSAPFIPPSLPPRPL